jgi:hypothetical protein
MPKAELRAVVRRRTNYLVYGYECADRNGREKLEQYLSVYEKEANGAKWLTFKAVIEDVDPGGRIVTRLPGETDPQLIDAAFPGFRRAESLTAWPARAVAVRFRSGEYPFKNSDQAKIHEYLTCTGQFAHDAGAAVRLVVAGTAAGKSYCTIRAWSGLGEVMLGTFAASAHLNNFRTEILKFTDVTEDEILVVDDGRSTIRKIMRHPEKIPSYKVVLVLHRTIGNCLRDSIVAGAVSGANEFSEFVRAFGVGLHVSDECHLELQSVVQLGMMLNVCKTFYLTATPSRTDWQEARVLSQQLPKRTALYLRGERRLDVRQLSYNTAPNLREKTDSVNRRNYFDVVNFFDYLMKDEKWPAWEEMVTGLVGSFFDEGGAVSVGVVVGGRLEFLDRVIGSMSAAFPGRTVGNFSSRVPAGPKRMAELERDIIVTTDKSFNGSINPERMSHLVFLAPIASPVIVEQIIGRLRGLNGAPCVVVDLWDAGFDQLADQARRRRTLYRKVAETFSEGEYKAPTHNH